MIVNPLDICVLLHILVTCLEFQKLQFAIHRSNFSLLVCEGRLGKVQQLL